MTDRTVARRAQRVPPRSSPQRAPSAPAGPPASTRTRTRSRDGAAAGLAASQTPAIRRRPLTSQYSVVVPPSVAVQHITAYGQLISTLCRPPAARTSAHRHSASPNHISTGTGRHPPPAAHRGGASLRRVRRLVDHCARALSARSAAQRRTDRAGSSRRCTQPRRPRTGTCSSLPTRVRVEAGACGSRRARTRVEAGGAAGVPVEDEGDAEGAGRPHAARGPGCSGPPHCDCAHALVIEADEARVGALKTQNLEGRRPVGALTVAVSERQEARAPAAAHRHAARHKARPDTGLAGPDDALRTRTAHTLLLRRRKPAAMAGHTWNIGDG